MNDMDQDSIMQSGGSAGGSPKDLQDLLSRHLPGLRAFIRLRMDRDLRARESSSDLAQSVCLDLFRHMEGFVYRGEPSLKAWLYTSALNKIRQHERYHRAEMREAKREAAPLPQETDASAILDCCASFFTPSRQAMARESLDMLEAAFDGLAEDYREVITLARIAGLPHAEVAERMGRTEGAVRTLLNRALVRLSSLLERMEHEPPSAAGG